MHARWYQPYLNRWISPDAIVPNPGNPQDLNRFAYVGGNPIRYSDPSGHMMWVGGGGETARILAEYRAPVEQIWSPEVVAVVEAKVHQPTAAEWALLGAGLVGVAALPSVLGASYAAVETVGCSTLTWGLAHPVHALVAKAVAEEAIEATVTQTPFDPGMVLLDVATQVGDDLLPRQQYNQYSVAFEMTLEPTDLGRSRFVHANRANAALDVALQNDAQYATGMEALIPGVSASVSVLGGRQPPNDWVWHHGQVPGAMQLVPQYQHTAGSPWWGALHPGGAGGYAGWAKPCGAP
jgi:hypothetical protein